MKKQNDATDYAAYGLDTTKKSADAPSKHRTIFCLWCNQNVATGFYLCFQNFCICTDCVTGAAAIENTWRWEDGGYCIKCRQVSGRQYASTTATILQVCRSCMEWAEEVLHIKSVNQTPMNFFEELNKALPGADLSIRIKEKDGVYTISILPAAGDASKVQPMLLTGSPADFDRDFFTVIVPKLQTTGLQVVQEAKVDAPAPAPEKKKAQKTEKPIEKPKSEKPASPAKQLPAAKESKYVEADLFAQAPVAEDPQTPQPDSETTENQTDAVQSGDDQGDEQGSAV